MQLRVWPEFDLIRPAGANRLIVGSKTVRTIVIINRYYFQSAFRQAALALSGIFLEPIGSL